MTFSLIQKLWKNLPNIEKGKYVAELANLETTEKKKITRAEMKFMESFCGLPKRPLSAYNIFVQNFRAAFEDDTKDFMACLSVAWKNINEDEKQQLQMQSDALTEKWKREMETYIKSLPKEQHAMMFSKYKLFQTKDKSLKRSVKREKCPTACLTIHDGPPPKKKQKTISESSVKSPESSPKKIAEKSLKKSPEKSLKKSPERPSKKSPERSLKKSPERSPKKKIKIKEPEYPSQSTAHYFMTKIYEGKPTKIHKAYKKLMKSQKLIYRQQMKDRRNIYIKDVSEYIKHISHAELAMFRLRTAESKSLQSEDIKWHSSTGTDDEKKDSSSGSDSDSS